MAIPAPTPEPYVEIQKPGQWSTGLCGCSANMCNCLMVTCCSCVTFGQISSRIGHNGLTEGSSCVLSGAIYFVAASFGFGCIPIWLLRQEVAKKTGVPSTVQDDCFSSVCCSPCTLCQMANHVGVQQDNKCSFEEPPLMETMHRI